MRTLAWASAALVLAIVLDERCGATTQPYAWRTVATGGGGYVTGIVYHPTERGLMYARTDSSGAFRWDQAGETWIALNDDIGGLDYAHERLGVAAIALDPSRPNSVYLACGQSGGLVGDPNGAILRSDDRGATWTVSVLPGVKLGAKEYGRQTGERLAVDPNLGDVLYLGTVKDGLWRSVDRGVTWAKVESFPSSRSLCTFVLIDPLSGAAGQSSRTIWVGMAEYSAASLYRSTDGGASWHAVAGQPGGAIPLRADVASLSGVRYLCLAYGTSSGPDAVTSGAVWRVNLATGAWTNVTPATGSWGYGAVSVAATNPSTLLVSTINRTDAGEEIYRSTDGGAHWNRVLQTGTLDHTQAPWAAGIDPYWPSDVRIDPFDSARAMFATAYGVYACDNISASSPVWRFRSRGLDCTEARAVISPPDGAHLLSAVASFDGFVHSDLDAAPQSRFAPALGSNDSLDFAEHLPTKMVRARAGTRDPALYSINGGASWIRFPAVAQTSYAGANVAISADGSTILWTQTGFAPYYSRDDGATWSRCTGAPPASFPAVADRVNPAKFYILDTGDWTVFLSTDSGASFGPAGKLPSGWTLVRRGANELRAVSGLEGNVWAPCGPNGLWRSTNSGASFAQVVGIAAAYEVGFGKAAPGRAHPAVYVWGTVQGVTGVFRSDDAGASWTRINDDRHQYGLINQITGDPRVYGRVYLATSGRGVIRGDIEAVLPTTMWAPFRTGEPGTWTPSHTLPPSTLFAATGLPGWASLDPATGAISGTPNVPAGTFAFVTLTAAIDGRNLQPSIVTLVVAGAGTAPTPVNLSTRAQVSTGEAVLIPGFVVSGTEPRTFLLRAVGPGLADRFQLGGTLPNPRLVLMNEDGMEIGRNDDWNNSPDPAVLRATTVSVGAFGLSEGSRDAAMLVALPPGVYTAICEEVDGGSGIGLVEVYDANPAASESAVANVSARVFVGTDDRAAIPGFVLRGGGTKRLLIRAVGPSLAHLGVRNVLADPQLTLMREGVALASNDDWAIGNDVDDLATAAQSVGAFPLQPGSRDAAMLATLVDVPGGYTVVIEGGGGGTGVALVEVYVVP